ncbi:MAG: prepilin-type N-terminal cleavage/methylation domain-containing protein [Candidatus Binatia bacterium]
MAPGLLLPSDMRTHRRRNAGFTLIELLVVTSIIGTLAAIAIPQFTSRQGKAFDSRVIQDTRNAAIAEEAKYGDDGEYLEGDCADLPGIHTSAGITCTTEVSGDSFTVTASHPSATKRCTWRSSTVPSLVCTRS